MGWDMGAAWRVPGRGAGPGDWVTGAATMAVFTGCACVVAFFGRTMVAHVLAVTGCPGA